MGIALVLESFAEPEPEETDGVSSDYLAGYEAGRAELLAQQDAEGRRALGEIAQLMADIDLSYAEARQEVLRSLGPLVEAIANGLLPKLSAAAVIPNLTEMIMEAAQLASETGIKVMLSPQDADLLADLDLNQTVTIGADPSLEPGLARLRSAGRESYLDIPKAEAAIRSALGTLNVTLERTDNGRDDGSETEPAAGHSDRNQSVGGARPASGW